MSGEFPPRFEIGSHGDGGRRIITLQGEIDGRAAEQLVAEVDRFLADPDPAGLVLDMAGISFVDSAGLRALISVEAEARGAQVTLSVVAPPREVVEVLRMTGLGERLTLGPRPTADGEEPEEFHERIELTLPRDLRSPARARAEVREAMAGLSRDDRAVAVLLTSEVVTNAVIHTHEPDGETIGLLITVAPALVRVQVFDPGAGFDPERPPPRPPDQGGRGLLLVDRLSSRWGAGELIGSNWRFGVWFELDPGSISLADEALAG
jgi:anti-anti-sigma factor